MKLTQHSHGIWPSQAYRQKILCETNQITGGSGVIDGFGVIHLDLGQVEDRPMKRTCSLDISESEARRLIEWLIAKLSEIETMRGIS